MFTLFPLVRILTITFACFVIAMMVAPLLIRLLRKFKMGKTIRTEASAPIFAKLHAAKAGTPTMGGLVIWVTVSFVTLIIALGCSLHLGSSCDWNFFTRAQTWLPLGAMIGAALVGLVDDYFNIRKIGPAGGGLRMRHRIVSYGIIAAIGAWWFYSKLDWHLLHVPFYGTFDLGWWYVPFFIFVLIATSNAVNITDGLDGLAGGPLIASFAGFGAIAFVQGKTDFAVFCAAIVGALMAFLWYNVPPASFFMGDTGAMSLGTVLGIVALYTNQPLLLPIIGLPFVIETVSVIIQLTSKKLFKRKVFKSAPLHHHLEASGWTEPQITFRFWIVALFSAGVGVVMALFDKF